MFVYWSAYILLCGLLNHLKNYQKIIPDRDIIFNPPPPLQPTCTEQNTIMVPSHIISIGPFIVWSVRYFPEVEESLVSASASEVLFVSNMIPTRISWFMLMDICHIFLALMLMQDPTDIFSVDSKIFCWTSATILDGDAQLIKDSSHATLPIGKIHSSRKVALTFEPMMWFRYFSPKCNIVIF